MRVGSGWRSSDAGRTRPHLSHAARLAGRFVWKAARGDFLVSVAAEAVGALGLAGVLLFAQQVAEKLTADPPIGDLRDVLPETIGLGLSLAVSGLAAVFVRRVRWLVAEQVTRHVQEEIIGVSTSVDYELYERQDFHDQLNRSNAQVAESSYQMAYDVLSLFNVLATSVVVILVLVRSVPEVLGVLVLIAIPSVAAARVSARLAYQTTYELTPNDRLRLYLYGALSRKPEARELRIFGLGDVLRRRWDGLYDDRMRRIRELVRRQMVFDGLAALIGALLVAGVLLVLVQAAVDGRISVANAAVAIVALQQLTSRLRSAASASGSLRQSTFFLDEFERFRALGAKDVAPPSAVISTLPRRLSVDHVSFRYPGTETLVLDDVSLEVGPGEIVALVGVSGGGKTTLAHLVAGLYRPTAGSISLDGVDIASIPRSEYWRSIAAVFQDFVRFELTARENIAMSEYARIDDMPGVTAAARRAGIDHALERLPSGYETMMSRSYDGGADLSVGQWQRLAVARAFFREAPLLILDEPAAALDAVAEKRLYERLVELCESRSVLLISHRFSTVRLADRICVLEGGRIAEQGAHEELMELGGRYAELFNLQASSYVGDQARGQPADWHGT
jgi:ATP-binding cassette subfamily B protein